MAVFYRLSYCWAPFEASRASTCPDGAFQHRWPIQERSFWGKPLFNTVIAHLATSSVPPDFLVVAIEMHFKEKIVQMLLLHWIPAFLLLKASQLERGRFLNMPHRYVYKRITLILSAELCFHFIFIIFQTCWGQLHPSRNKIHLDSRTVSVEGTII